MRLLVTGSERSGTAWMAECLRRAGVDCGHERAFNLDGVSDDWVAESSWLAAPHRPDAYTVHLVRDRDAQIRSSVERNTFGPPLSTWGEYAVRWCPRILDTDDPVQRAVIYHEDWNALVIGDETLRLEQVTAADVTRLARLVDPAAHVDRLPPPVNVQPAELRGRVA